MYERVVEFDSVSRRFENALALDEVSFDIQQGRVYGLVGSNGAGKTTIMKHILGLLRAQQGSVHVFGKDPAQDPVPVLSQVGYLSEHRDLPEWMRIEELMWYTRAHYPGWNNAYCQELLETFALDPAKRVRELSKGMRAQVALIAAVSHHPQLLLLDEPSTGLDAIVRQDILDAVIRAVADDGRTAIFSSHLLDEVERMSDQILMIDGGRIVLQGTVEDIRQSHHLLHVRYASDSHASPALDGLLQAEGHGRNWSLLVEGEETAIHRHMSSLQIAVVESRSATLEEIFVARAGRSPLVAEENIACPA